MLFYVKVPNEILTRSRSDEADKTATGIIIIIIIIRNIMAVGRGGGGGAIFSLVKMKLFTQTFKGSIDTYLLLS